MNEHPFIITFLHTTERNRVKSSEFSIHSMTTLSTNDERNQITFHFVFLVYRIFHRNDFTFSIQQNGASASRIKF